MKSPQLVRGLLLVVLFAGLYACVDTFSPKLNLNADLLVVEGILTDQAKTQAITLSRSRSNPDSNTTTPVTKAQVQILVNGTTPVSLTETRAGYYQLPATFRGRVGDSYLLRFTTAEGGHYESTTETMVAVPPIQKVYDQFEPKGPSRTYDGQPTPTSNVYLDYQDPPGERNFYLWRWTLYEKQDWCATCRQGRYQLTADQSGNLTGTCIPDPTLSYYNYYDYTCRTNCWDLFYSQNINVFADVYTNGQPQLGRLIAQIPVYTINPALLDIEQLSLTAGAYRYYSLFQQQTPGSNGGQRTQREQCQRKRGGVFHGLGGVDQSLLARPRERTPG